MATTPNLNGLCPPPFMQETLFSNSTGYIAGRFCQAVPSGTQTISCCLPCPLQSWRYPDDVQAKTVAAGWLAVALLPLTAFLLISYAVLPIKWTNRHYITICFTLAVACIQIAFVIPLGTKPAQCHNEITPNDMTTSLSCAFTGALLLFGGIAVVTWSLIRTIALHLQVCWEVVIGPRFMWLAFTTGLGIPILITALMMVYTGVSYRFGDVCHINSPNSLGDYWIPLMVFASLALIMQVITMAYCIHVYVKSLFDPDPTSTNNSELPSYHGSVRTVTARQAYKRVRRVIQLQWRSMALVITILINVIFFAIVFVKLDNSLQWTPANIQAATGWIICLAINRDPSKCVAAASGVALNEATLLAVLVLLSIATFWNFIFTVRWTMVQGWVDFVKGRFVQRVEFVSVDARSHFPDTRTYEMLNSRQQNLKTPEPAVRLQSPAPAHGSGFDDDDDDDKEDDSYYGRDATYKSPAMSFSGPRPPSAAQNQSSRHWDPSATFAPSEAAYSQQNPRHS